MNRRGFFKVVAGGILVAISPAMINQRLYAEDGSVLLTSHKRVMLTDANGSPLKYDKLKSETAYAFYYPFKATPCFLLKTDTKTQKDVKLKAEDGTEYVWKGGVGSGENLVAFSAICPHQLTHPTPETSFISYVGKGQKTMACKRDQVIVCASHLSAYNPKEGCRVEGGPAPQPLASIVLEVDKDNNIYATAVLGSDKFVDYFKAYKPEFKEFFGGRRKAKKEIEKSSQTLELKEFTKEIIVY